MPLSSWSCWMHAIAAVHDEPEEVRLVIKLCQCGWSWHVVTNHQLEILRAPLSSWSCWMRAIAAVHDEPEEVRLAHHSVSADGHGMWWLITSWRSWERRWVVEVVECVQLLRCMMNPRRSDLSTILSVRMVMTCGDYRYNHQLEILRMQLSSWSCWMRAIAAVHDEPEEVRLVHHSISADGHGMWWLITSWRSWERRWIDEVVHWWNSIDLACNPALLCLIVPPFYNVRTHIAGWWFGTCFIVHNIWDNPSHWLICFRGVETCWNYQPDCFLMVLNCFSPTSLLRPSSEVLQWSWSHAGEIWGPAAGPSPDLMSMKSQVIPAVCVFFKVGYNITILI